MSQSLQQYSISDLTQNLDVTIHGDKTCIIKNISTIQGAKLGSLTFLVNPLYKKHLPDTQASAVILILEDLPLCPTNAIVCKDPYFIYSQVAQFFNDKPTGSNGIHASAVVGKHCQIDASASIGPNVVIGDHVTVGANVRIAAGCVIGDQSKLGASTQLEPNVTLYHNIQLGERVLIGSGTVIGSDGFGMAKHKGVWHKVPQLGGVIIEDDVEIGSNCSIDRGAIESTVIEKGAKLDNLIQVGHNVRIGQNTAIAGCVGISGSTTIGNNCLIAGGVGFVGHIQVTDSVVITGNTVVSKSIKNPGIYSSGVGGLVTNLEWRKNSARLHRLEHLDKRVKLLESLLKETKERTNT